MVRWHPAYQELTGLGEVLDRGDVADSAVRGEGESGNLVLADSVLSG
jgi:hypothetical protein